jgi:hypothetical protein
MTDTLIKDVYHVRLDEGRCRSGEALAAMLVRDIAGVQTVAISKEGALIALVSGDRDVHEEIVRAVVTAGFAPTSVTASPFEKLVERMPLSIAEAVALEMPDPPKVPVRVPIETQLSQRVRIEVTDGYDPADIVVAAGIPLEITFSEGHGCLAKVLFESLGIEADLTDGGAVVHIPALEPGVYAFSCGMHMVHGSVTAE